MCDLMWSDPYEDDTKDPDVDPDGPAIVSI